MSKTKNITLELPIQFMDELERQWDLYQTKKKTGYKKINKSLVYRYYLISAVERYIDLKKFVIKAPINFSYSNECSKKDYVNRIGFVIPIEVDLALTELCKAYPFMKKKGLSEFLICQEYERLPFDSVVRILEMGRKK